MGSWGAGGGGWGVCGRRRPQDTVFWFLFAVEGAETYSSADGESSSQRCDRVDRLETRETSGVSGPELKIRHRGAGVVGCGGRGVGSYIYR